MEMDWGDRGQVLAAVEQNGLDLCHAAYDLLGDRIVVLAAVTQNGKALRDAPVRRRAPHC